MRELFLPCDRTVMAERTGSHLDGQPHGNRVRQEVTCRDSVAQLMPRDCQALALGVHDWVRQARLDVAHRLANVAPGESLAVVLECIPRRKGESPLDHGRSA